MMKLIASFTKSIEKYCATLLPVAYLFRLYYSPIVEKEIMLARITKDDKVICIGGGSLPWTAIEIARQSGAEVTVIDCDCGAVKLASNFIKTINMDHCVKVVLGNGLTINPINCTVVHLALQVQPQEQVLSHLLGYVQNSTRILMRVSKQPCMISSMSKHCLCKFVNQKVPTMKSTMLIKKLDIGK